MLYAVINMHACRQYDRRLYILILMVELQVATDHVDFGVKWQILPFMPKLRENFTPIMPLCIKGKFYAKAVIVYITTAFYSIEFGVKSPFEESWHL